MTQRPFKRPQKLNSLRKKKKSSFGRFCLKCLFVFFVLGLLGAGGAYLGYIVFTPHYEKWAEEYDLELINELEAPSIIFDRKGREIGRIFAENRSYVPLEKISPNMINALIAQEDARFRLHNGFDALGIARASLELLKSRSVNQGASSITQQLARNAFDLKKRAKERGESGFGRKIAEIFLALRIEKRYSKDQILEFYLNRVYFGSGFYGIRSASLGYFGKEPKELTIREAASIAALIKNPNGLSPLRNPKGNLQWRNHVLHRLTLEGFLTPTEAEKLKKMDLGLNPKPLTRGVSHIYEQIANRVSEYLNEDVNTTGGLQIYTTLDKDIQEEALSSLQKKLGEIENRPGYRHPLAKNYKPTSTTPPQYLDGAVLVLENKTGAILAYIGGRDYAKRQFDSIELGGRPPGTAFLPIVYAAAFENKFTPASLLMDDALDNRLAGIGGSEGILGEWGGETHKNKYEGEITARRALSGSKISATVRLGQVLGTKPLVDTMKKLKLSAPVPESYSAEGTPIYRNRIFVGTEQLSLKELTRAYTALPNEGKLPKDLYFIDKINDSTGYTIWQSPQSQSTPTLDPALSPASAYQVYSILKDSLQSGSAQQLKALFPQNFKGVVQTGTNYDFSDNWCFATTPNLTCGVWVGFTEGKKAIYPGAFSVDTAGPILAKTMSKALPLFPQEELKTPTDIETLEICRLSGKRATKFCYDIDPRSQKDKPLYRRCTYSEIFAKGDISLSSCPVHEEDILSLDGFINSLSSDKSNRILPVPPVIPQANALLGDDPYQSEKVVVKIPKNYDPHYNANTGENNAGAVVIEEDEAEANPHHDTELQIAPPPKLKLIIPQELLEIN